MQKSIEHKWQYRQPPSAVWEYLTQPELIAQWLMPNDFAPIVGHQFQFRTRPLPNFDFDGIAYCTVMEVKPFEKLIYSWKGGPGNGIINLDSIVEWTLFEKDGGTELQLRHSGFKAVENMIIFSAMSDGWYRNIQKIEHLLADRENGTTQS